MNTNELAFPCRVTRLRAPVSSEMCNFSPDPRKKRKKKKEKKEATVNANHWKFLIYIEMTVCTNKGQEQIGKGKRNETEKS